MKKFLFVALLISSCSIASGQRASDTLLRSSGFYLSPAATAFFLPKETAQPSPRFGFNMGFRFQNKLKMGFFLESGVGISLLGAAYPAQQHNTIYMSNFYSYYSTFMASELWINAPFLAGYRTQKGKVRFEGALGIAMNVKIMDFSHNVYDGTLPPYIDEYQRNGPPFSFGTSLSAVARAGISIPVGERLWVDIRPTARYQFLYFAPEGKDVRECVYTDEQRWSAGIDISLIWALDDKTPESSYFTETLSEEPSPSYTNQYNASRESEQKQTTFAKGWKNFAYIELLGSGLSYTFNYERTFFSKKAINLNARGGFGLLMNPGGFRSRINPVVLYTFPVGINMTVGRFRKKFEVGVLADMQSISSQMFNLNIVPSVAYRFESRSHFFLRLGVMAHIFTDDGSVLPGLGVSLGGGF